MNTYNVEQIDPTVRFIATVNGTPVTLPSGEVYLFVRQIDAEAWIDRAKVNEKLLTETEAAMKAPETIVNADVPKKKSRSRKKDPGLK